VHDGDELLDGVVGRDVDLYERGVTDAVGHAGAQVVDDDRVAARPEQAHDVRADVAGTAGHEDGHGRSLAMRNAGGGCGSGAQRLAQAVQVTRSCSAMALRAASSQFVTRTTEPRP